MYSIPVVVNKHNTARIASCWFIIHYRLVMHGNSYIKYKENALYLAFLWTKSLSAIWSTMPKMYQNTLQILTMFISCTMTKYSFMTPMNAHLTHKNIVLYHCYTFWHHLRFLQRPLCQNLKVTTIEYKSNPYSSQYP